MGFFSNSRLHFHRTEGVELLLISLKNTHYNHDRCGISLKLNLRFLSPPTGCVSRSSSVKWTFVVTLGSFDRFLRGLRVPNLLLWCQFWTPNPNPLSRYQICILCGSSSARLLSGKTGASLAREGGTAAARLAQTIAGTKRRLGPQTRVPARPAPAPLCSPSDRERTRVFFPTG